MDLCLTFSHFEELYKNGYSVDILFLLKLAQDEEDLDIKALCDQGPKFKVLFQGIVRKGLVTKDGKVTITGKAVLDILKIQTESAIPLKRRVDVTDDFERWWKIYPGTDSFTYKGKSFSGTRSIRRAKDECKEMFAKILNEGEYTADEMIAALQFEVEQKKDNSVKAGENKLKYMQNSLTYLNQRTFEPYIELIKEGVNNAPSPSIPTGSVDI